jgi:hypothetical protein
MGLVLLRLMIWGTNSKINIVGMKPVDPFEEIDLGYSVSLI